MMKEMQILFTLHVKKYLYEHCKNLHVKWEILNKNKYYICK